jgi:hypothetical protein
MLRRYVITGKTTEVSTSMNLWDLLRIVSMGYITFNTTTSIGVVIIGMFST